MEIICEKNQCTGCEACYNVCPRNAIKMVEDERGFSYPKIDSISCVNCGLCKKVCPMKSIKNSTNMIKQDAYIGKTIDLDRMKSSSGGMFPYFAYQFIDKGGVIYGAEYDGLEVKHGRAQCKEDVDLFRQSKYIQSAIGKVYIQIQQDLIDEKYVYFTGCPCQVAGLKSFLKISSCNTERLYTQDFACHGVASKKVYYNYISSLEKKFKSKVKTINFRGKPQKGKIQSIIVTFTNGKKYVSLSTNYDFFYYLFLNNFIVRPSCFQCQFANKERISDITLADCFKVHVNHREMDDGWGLSFFTLNTSKGMELLNKESSHLDICKVDIDDYIPLTMKQSTTKPIDYDLFWQEYSNNGIKSANKLYSHYDNKKVIKKKIICLLSILHIDNLVKKILQ